MLKQHGRMLLEWLEAFLTAVETGSVTAAAHRLGCAQSVVSRRIQRLERDLGVQLLDRRAAGVTLTPAGEPVAAFARDTLDAYTALRTDLQEQPGTAAGLLRIAASTIPGEHLAPALVMHFADRHPEARTRLSVTDTAGVYRQLLNRRAHVGFVGHRSDELADRFTFVPFAADEIVLAVPVGHPFTGVRAVTVEALGGQRLLTREAGSGTQRTFTEALAAAGLHLPSSVTPVSLGSTQAVLSAVDAGLGIGVVSARAVADHPSGISAVRLEGVALTRALWLAYETRRARSPLQAAFVAYAGQWSRNHGAW